MRIARGYIVPNTDPGEAISLSGEGDGLTFRKEVIYEGNFVKKTKDIDQPFSVNAELMDYWSRISNEMIEDGIKIPGPLMHRKDPESNRALVLGFQRGINSKGKQSLYAIMRFRDIEAAKLAKTTDVSIYVPEEPVFSGTGKKYVKPIRHVALTDYPVVNGLEDFKSIAASYDGPLELSAITRVAKIAKASPGFLAKHGPHLAGGLVGASIAHKIAHKVAPNNAAVGIGADIAGHAVGGSLVHRAIHGGPSLAKHPIVTRIAKPLVGIALRHPLGVAAGALGLTAASMLAKRRMARHRGISASIDSLELSEHDNIKARDNAGRFASAGGSKSADRRRRGSVREANSSSGLLFRDSSNTGSVTSHPTFENTLKNVKAHFHEVAGTGANHEGKGPLHAVKHAAIAGAAAGASIEGGRRLAIHGKNLLKRAVVKGKKEITHRPQTLKNAGGAVKYHERALAIGSKLTPQRRKQIKKMAASAAARHAKLLASAKGTAAKRIAKEGLVKTAFRVAHGVGKAFKQHKLVKIATIATAVAAGTTTAYNHAKAARQSLH